MQDDGPRSTIPSGPTSAGGDEPVDAHAIAADNALLRARVAEAERTRDEFLSMASHELCTPIYALALSTQSLRAQVGKEPLDGPRLRANVDAMERQVARLSRLISGMLDASSLGARAALDLRRVDLGAVVAEVVARFAEEARRVGCALDLRLAEGVVGFWDASRIDTLVHNLLSNAIKYGPGKPVRISLAGSDDAAILTVEDEGIGIPEAAQPRIFTRFERAVSPRRYGGLGVGLFIVAQILEAHEGQIEVRSAPGKGATFVVRLPFGCEGAPAVKAAS
jgi:signal transduction histidine kinase